MDKTGFDTTTLKALGTGAAIGGGAAALVALIRQVAEANRQRKLRRDLDEQSVDPNTIVLRLGRKNASASAPQPCSRLAETRGCLESAEYHPGSGDEPARTLDGRYSVRQPVGPDGPALDPKRASGGIFSGSVGDEAGDMLAVGGGLTLGYMLVSKIRDKLEQKRLKKQIAAAQTEYLDLLDGKTVKGAEAFDLLFGPVDDPPDDGGSGIPKEAGIFHDLYNLPSTSRHLSAAGLAYMILMAGGSAYLTKKLLENKFSQEDEEAPREDTRILFKAGSAEFEIDPGAMLATVAILRDCIRDSNPPGVKSAAFDDYSFVDEIAGMDGGKQWLLDQYAVQNGLKRGKSDFKLPLSMLARHGRTLLDVKLDPASHAPALRSRVMDLARKDPESWFKLLGDERNQDLVRLKAGEQLDQLASRGGLLGFLSGIPVVGDFIRKLVGWYATGTSNGRRAAAGRLLGSLGLDNDAAARMLSRYDFSGRGWRQSAASPAPAAPAASPAQAAPAVPAAPAAAPAPAAPVTPEVAKTAGVLPSFVEDYLAHASRSKTLSDKTNADVLKELARLRLELESSGLGERRGGAKKRKGGKQGGRVAESRGAGPGVDVEFDESLTGGLTAADKRALASAFGGTL